MTNSTDSAVSNPYVGPRTFTEKEGRFFFGREREARDLTARIVSERLLLFYAQSGAGKSSLLNARVIPKLRDEERFQVLPVGRVSGELPAGVAQVDNIYAFNLMTSLDQSGADPARVTQVTLSDFLARLARETAVDDQGQRVVRWVYKPELAAEQATADAQAARGPRFALVIDQFEEIITAHPGRWREREAFFRQLNKALLDDPNLWVVLALREDYVAALDPYAELTFNRLRARFYMERMQVSNGLEAVRRPAELGGRPFAPGVAEQLVDELRQVRVPGRDDTIPGQYVEPVQLQVVCYQLWERLAEGADGTDVTPISFDDLAEAGDVNQALEQFYGETLAAVLAEKGVHEAGVSERGLRTWFDKELITETGIRNTVFRNEAAGRTGSMPNVAVDALVRRFLLRTELRGGGAWVELVHDRFVEPIRVSNAAWFPLHLSALQRQAALWDEQGRSSGLLLRDEALAEAEAWAADHADELVSHEQDFLTACRDARQVAEWRKRRGIALAVLAGGIALLLLMVGILALNLTQQNDRLTASYIELDRTLVTLEISRTQLTEERDRALAAEAREVALRGEALSVTLARIISRLDLSSEDQRQFALLLSQEAMASSPTLQAESASIEALDAAYRNRSGWQPMITPTLFFTQGIALPFSSPLTMTLRRDGEAVAAVVGGTDVVVAVDPSAWVTRQLTTSFASIGALALSDDGKYIAVAGCGQKPDTETTNDPKQSLQNSTGAPAVNSDCSNWRIEVMPVTDDSHFHRTVPVDIAAGGVKALAFHPFLLQLVVATNDGWLLHWRLSGSEPVAQQVVTSILKNPVDLTVSSDGMYLAALDVQGRNRVWSWATWDERDDDWPPDLYANSYRGVSFVRDGSWFATVSNCPNSPGGQEYGDPCPVLRLWQRGTQELIGGPIPVGDNIMDVGFDELSDTLTTIGSRGLIRWNLNRDDWQELVCQRVGRTLTYDEWKEAFPNDDLTTYQGACSRPPHSSFVTTRIAEATKTLDDCNYIGTETGWQMLDYGDIPRLQTAVTILFGQALERFERNQTDMNNPAAACLQEANTLLADEGKDEIPLETAMDIAFQLLDGESKMRTDPEFSVAELGAVQAQLAQWSVDLDNRLATDYLTLCFDLGFFDACNMAQNLNANALLTSGETRTGEILQGAEGTPWYFIGQQGQAVSIAMDAVGDSFDTYLYLDGSEGRLGLMSNDDAAGSLNSLIDNFVLSADGMYRIWPQAWSGSGAYRLTLTARDLPQLEFGASAPATSAADGPWLFEGNAGQLVTLEIGNGEGIYGSHLTLRRSGDNWPIAENYDDGRIDPVVLPADDLYLVSADPGSASGSFSVTLNLVESRLLTIDAQEDSAVAVSTTAADEVWAFEGTAGQIVDVTLTTTDPDQFDPEVAMLDAEGGLPSDSSGDRMTARISSYFLPQTGPYYIQTGPARNSTPYTLTLRTVLPPSLTLGIDEEASLNQVAIWQLDASPGQIISATLATTDATTQPAMEILSSHGAPLKLATTDGETGIAAISGFILPGAGPFYVRVSGLDDQTPYRLFVDEIEPAVLQIGGSVTSTTNGVTFWTLDGEPGQIIQISMEAAKDSGLDSLVRLYGPEGKLIDSNDDGGAGNNSLLTLILPDSPAFMVQADRYGGSGEFTLSVVELATETIPLDGTSVPLVSDRAWTVAGETGQVLTIDIRDGGDGSYQPLQLVTADGLRIGSSDGNASLAALLPQAGTYYILPRFDLDYGGDTIKATLTSATDATSLDEAASQTLRNLALNNAIDQALELYTWGTIDRNVAFTADALNALCWHGAVYGALHGSADRVTTNCEELVDTADTTDPYYLTLRHDIRGVARALTGNIDGAIEDFEYFVDNGGDHASQRQEWIDRLRAGEPVADVLDEATLRELLQE